MPAAFCSALSGAAGEKDFFGRAAGQVQLLKGGRRNGRDGPERTDRFWSFSAFQAEFTVREVVLKLIFKNPQSQGLESAVLGGFDEVRHLIEEQLLHATPNSCRTARAPATTVR